MRVLRFLGVFILVVLLTLLTHIGGVIYLLSRLAFPFLNRRVSNRVLRACYISSVFLILYITFTFLLIPSIASHFGRVPMPLFTSGNIQPVNIVTCILNRHYVRTDLKDVAIKVANEMNQQFPGTTLNYLDAGFPFFDEFPLFPHLSHNDGKKLDIALYYTIASTGKETNSCPSFIGYGISEEPGADEVNTALTCGTQGFWQYSLMKKMLPQSNKKNYVFDAVRTKDVIQLFCAAPNIEKIFIEPHLKTRMGLTNGKIRFHGCQAVRHDDHIHLQIL